MATYDFTDSWSLGTYIKDGYSYNFTQSDYDNAIAEAQDTYGYNYHGFGGYLAPGWEDHGSDSQSSFGSSYGSGYVDLLNFVDFDYSDDFSSDWDAMNSILGDDSTVGAYATAINAGDEGFIQVVSNFNGYNTFASEEYYDLSSDKLFDLWHIDGLNDFDYVTAQIVAGDLTDANLSVWGETDGYMTSGGPDMLSWSYVNHDAIAIDTFNMDGDHAYGEFTYTMNIVTDWNDCSESDYETFDWGYMDYGSMNSDEFGDMNWGYIEYDEFTSTSYTEINWAYAEFDEFENNDIYSDLNWGYIEYDEFTSTSYTDIDWAYAEFNEFDNNWSDLNWGYVEYDEFTSTSYTEIDWGEVEYNEFEDTSYISCDWGEVQYNELDNKDYKQANWGKVQYNEFDKLEYKQASWNKVQMGELGNDDYSAIDWGKVEYKEVLKSNSNLNNVNWGKVQTNEWDKGDIKILTKSSTDKKLDKLKKAELDINILKKGSSFKGDNDDDVIAAKGKLLKKKINVKGGDGNDTFVLKKGKGSMIINDFEDNVDEINFALCGSASKIKLEQVGNDTYVYSGNDELAKIKNIKKSVLKKKSYGFV